MTTIIPALYIANQWLTLGMFAAKIFIMTLQYGLCEDGITGAIVYIAFVRWISIDDLLFLLT
jgi:hypothetical protein